MKQNALFFHDACNISMTKNFEDKIPTKLASISNCWRLELPHMSSMVESFLEITWLLYLIHVILFFLHRMKFSVGESRSCALFTNNNKWKAAAFVATTLLQLQRCRNVDCSFPSTLNGATVCRSEHNAELDTSFDWRSFPFVAACHDDATTLWDFDMNVNQSSIWIRWRKTL